MPIVTSDFGRTLVPGLAGESKKIKYQYYDDIMYIVYDGVYCYLHCMDKKYRIETSLKYLKDYLPKDVFFECNRSTIINISYIKEYNRLDAFILMEDNREFDLSRRRVKAFHQIRTSATKSLQSDDEP